MISHPTPPPGDGAQLLFDPLIQSHYERRKHKNLRRKENIHSPTLS